MCPQGTWGQAASQIKYASQLVAAVVINPIVVHASSMAGPLSIQSWLQMLEQ